MTFQGSKQKYAKYICPIIQQCINDNHVNTFIDLFVGGANIIKNIKCENKIGIDNNPYLIALWKKLQEPNFQFPPFPQRTDWDRCKNGLEKEDWFVGLVSIFCSNVTGGFPAGYDQYEFKYTGRVNTCKKDLPLIKDIQFVCDDYKSILDQYKGVVIYCDPPYENARGYNYKKFDNADFWDFARKLSKDNYVFVSESSAPEDFEAVWSMNTQRNFRGKLTTREENLFVYKRLAA